MLHRQARPTPAPPRPAPPRPTPPLQFQFNQRLLALANTELPSDIGNPFRLPRRGGAEDAMPLRDANPSSCDGPMTRSDMETEGKEHQARLQAVEMATNGGTEAEMQAAGV
jgi:hypothetical protein